MDFFALALPAFDHSTSEHPASDIPHFWSVPDGALVGLATARGTSLREANRRCLRTLRSLKGESVQYRIDADRALS